MGQRPLQRDQQGRTSVGPLEVGDERQLHGQPGGTRGRGLAQEGLGHRTEIQEGELRGCAWSQRPGGLLGRAAIVLVLQAHLARAQQWMPGDLGARLTDHQLRHLDADLHARGDEGTRDAVSG